MGPADVYRQKTPLKGTPPLFTVTGRAGFVDSVPAEILLEFDRVRPVNIAIPVIIGNAGISNGAGPGQGTPPEIPLEGNRVSAVHVIVTVEIKLALAHIAYPVAVAVQLIVVADQVGAAAIGVPDAAQKGYKNQNGSLNWLEFR